MTENSSVNSIRDKLLTLATVNVLQPARKQLLFKKLSDYMSREQLGSILKKLVQEKIITREKGYYRTTYRGSRLSISVKPRKLRDIQRMKHLLVIGKQRGGD